MQSSSMSNSETGKGKPPNWSILTCTQLIPAANQPKANIKPCLAAALGDLSRIVNNQIGKITKTKPLKIY